MALMLYRLGRAMFGKPKRVLAIWLLALVAFVGIGFGLGGQLKESYVIPGTESQEAIDLLANVFPQTAGASAQIVVQAPAGADVRDEPYRSGIEALTADAKAVSGVAEALSPFSEFAGKAISDDNRTAYVQVQFEKASNEVPPSSLEELQATKNAGEDVGLEVAYGGSVFNTQSFGLKISEVFGVIFAGLVLIVTFGSLRAAGMPLATALIGVGISFGALMIAAAFTIVSSSAPVLAIMLGLAVGIDYALFIVSRHRSNLARGMDPAESAGQSLATAGSAVVFAGITVIISLLGLLVVGIPFLSVMGLGAAAAVAVSIVGALTLLPALLGISGRKLIPKAGSRAERRAQSSDEGKARTAGRRWVDTVLKAPIVFAVLIVGMLGAASVPAASLDLNLPTAESQPKDSTQYQAYALIRDGFGPGYNGPLIVTVDITQTTEVLDDLDAIAAELRTIDGVDYVGKPIPNPTVDTAIIRVVPTTAPDDPATKALVERIRDLEPQIVAEYDTPIAVTGYTAISIDISNRLAEALVPFALIVVGLSMVLLLIVFRSIFVPIKAALGFLLSIGGAIGATVVVFQWGWGAEFFGIEQPGPILSFLPVLLIAILFGLAMDYEVFLSSGMRESYVHAREDAPARNAIVYGFQNAARVVTAAALIMLFVFGSFVPEGTGDIKAIAFALAIGVAIDAFLVRMTLGPALMALAGRGAWWLPAWLDRILPNVDIEGESLLAHREAKHWAESQDALASAERLRIDYRDADGQAARVGPLSFRANRGEVLLVTGHSLERRLVLLTLAGRIEPAGGIAQLLAIPVTTEARHLAHAARVVDLEAEVARADVDGDEPFARCQSALDAALAESPSVLLVALPDTDRVELGKYLQQVASAAGATPLVVSGPAWASEADWPLNARPVSVSTEGALR